MKVASAKWRLNPRTNRWHKARPPGTTRYSRLPGGSGYQNCWEGMLPTEYLQNSPRPPGPAIWKGRWYCTGCSETFKKMHELLNHRRADRCGGRFLPEDEREILNSGRPRKPKPLTILEKAKLFEEQRRTICAKREAKRERNEHRVRVRTEQVEKRREWIRHGKIR
jgi:hypothetical protein